MWCPRRCQTRTRGFKCSQIGWSNRHSDDPLRSEPTAIAMHGATISANQCSHWRNRSEITLRPADYQFTAGSISRAQRKSGLAKLQCGGGHGSECLLWSVHASFFITKLRLDFAATASMCGSIMTSATYDVGEAFARLTVVFEDAAGHAAEGQSARLSATAREELVGALATALNDARSGLVEIRSEMDR